MVLFVHLFSKAGHCNSYSFALVVCQLCARGPPLAQLPDPYAAAAAVVGGAHPRLAAVRWATVLAGLLERAWATGPRTPRTTQ